MYYNWCETASGQMWSTEDELINNFTLADLVSGISRCCRYSGQLKDSVEQYVVAEHSYLVAMALDRDLPEPFSYYDVIARRNIIRAGLAHDLTEGLMVDLPRPIKKQDPWYQGQEAKFEKVIRKRFGLIETPKIVHEYDHRICLDERKHLMNPSHLEWGDDHLKPLNVEPQGWSPSEARRRFMDLWSQLELPTV